MGPGTQTAQSFALALDLLPEEAREPALDVLVKDIEAHQGHLTTGMFGTKFLLDVLSERGRGDLAARIAGQTTFPGWGHMLERGATTLWEHWEYSDDVYSHDHPMFGSVAEWFFKWVGGVRPAPDAVGFDRIIIAPSFESGLDSARASYDSVRGRVETVWKVEEGRLTLDVQIPVGSSAEVHIPAASPEEVLEGGKPVREAVGVKFLLDVLSEGGRGDVAARIAGQTTFPGWGHMLGRGATTLWEHWEYSDDVYSHDHPMFGSVAEWFFKWIGGIRPAPDAVGFDRIIIVPSFETGLTWAAASYDSIRGRVETRWEIGEHRLTLDVWIPVGSSAEVHIPAASPEEVLEGGKPAREAVGVKFLRLERGRAAFAVASGHYHFASTAAGAENPSAR